MTLTLSNIAEVKRTKHSIKQEKTSGITIKDLIYSVWGRVPQEEKLDEKFSDTKDKKSLKNLNIK